HQAPEHGGLVAAARSHLEHLAHRLLLEEELRHDPHDHGARDRLAVPDRERHVLVRARGDALVHERVARDRRHRAQHALVGHALRAQVFDHAHARALGGHADAGRAHRASIHLPTSGIWSPCVRSTCSGVIDTARRSSALKSVPGPASRAAPAGPTQYTVSPRGFLPGTTGCALWRRPRRVISWPVMASYGTSGTF